MLVMSYALYGMVILLIEVFLFITTYVGHRIRTTRSSDRTPHFLWRIQRCSWYKSFVRKNTKLVHL